MRYYLALLWLFGALFADPLPSWNEGAAKRAILSFVEETTQGGGKGHIPPKDRVAVFDEDGTLWIEQPLYVEFFFALDRVKELASKHPEWKNEEPYKSIIEGKLEAVKGYNEKDIAKIIAATHAGITIDQFHEEVRKWLKTAVHPRFNRPFKELIYQPMLEVLHLLRLHQFHIYIVSGGGQEFIRSYAEEVYKVPVENVIGSASKVKYEYQEGHPILIKEPEILFVDNFAGKVEGINLIVGKKSHIAFGNSTGDQQMLEWTQSNSGEIYSC